MSGAGGWRESRTVSINSKEQSIAFWNTEKEASPQTASPSSECQLIINEYIRTMPLVEPSQRSSLISLNIKTLHTTLWISASGSQAISYQPIRHIPIAESSQRQHIIPLIHRAMRITSHFREDVYETTLGRCLVHQEVRYEIILRWQLAHRKGGLYTDCMWECIHQTHHYE